MAEALTMFVCGKEQTKNISFFNNLTHHISDAYKDQLLLHTLVWQIHVQYKCLHVKHIT